VPFSRPCCFTPCDRCNARPPIGGVASHLWPPWV
jgi:hypothetical protein